MNWNSFVGWGRNGGYQNAIATFRDGKVCDAGNKGVQGFSHNGVRSWGIRSDAAKFENNMMRAELVRALLTNDIFAQASFAGADSKAFMEGSSSTIPDEILKTISEKLGREFKSDDFNKGRPLTRRRVDKICEAVTKKTEEENAAVKKSVFSGSNGSGAVKGQIVELVSIPDASNEKVAVKGAENAKQLVSNRVARASLDKAYACLNCDAKSLSNKIKSIGAEDIKLFKKIDMELLFSYLDTADKNLTLKLNAKDRDGEAANMRKELLSLITFVRKGLEEADRLEEGKALLSESFSDVHDERSFAAKSLVANKKGEGSTHTISDLFISPGRIGLEQAYLNADPSEVDSIGKMRTELGKWGVFNDKGNKQHSDLMNVGDTTVANLFNSYVRDDISDADKAAEIKRLTKIAADQAAKNSTFNDQPKSANDIKIF